MNETVAYMPLENGEEAVLCVLDKSGEIREYPLGEYQLIGRDTPSSSADIRVNSSITSRKHGEIRKLSDGYCYRDLKSLNGTFINGELYGKDTGQNVRLLRHGDVLRIDQSNLSRTHEDAVLLLFLQGKGGFTWNRQVLDENTGHIRIGRDVGGSDGLKLDDERISRRHATFQRGLNGWSIVDHGSTNGVYLNNQRIDEPMPLSRLDVVRIADVTFLFLGDALLFNAQESQSAQLFIHIEERSVRKMFKKHVLLKDINLVVNPGEMVLILGGSGAGKTTFFNAVMGYEKAEGEIRHGDVDIYKEYSKMKYQIGFVPQQDLIREEDTVIATLDNAARMKMPEDTKPEKRKERIENVLELLGLQRERDSMVRKLSGGQKKRLSIAVEFIADPSLFFLDEPDSGLDGIMATSLMKNLRVIADEGKIVMVITHAPDRVAHLFDKLVVLAKSSVTNSGHLAFFGTIEEAKKFFETDSMEGIVRRINRPDEGGEGKSDYYIEKYREAAEKGEL